MNKYPGGVWPVMITPFHRNGEIDEEGLYALVNWYIANGVNGLFAACLSSEIYNLSLEERVKIVEISIKAANGRVPVIASGHISDNFNQQVKELNRIAETGADAVVIITNHLATPDENSSVWIRNLEKLMKELPESVDLGLYECPIPYKRVLDLDMISYCAGTERFYFLKDTCCDAKSIRQKLQAIKGTNLQLYNANVSTLLESLKDGASGFSGIMANFHPELFVWLINNIYHKNAQHVQDVLTLASLIERQLYPVNAKFHLNEIEGLPITTYSRVQDDSLLHTTWCDEVKTMNRVCNHLYENDCLRH